MRLATILIALFMAIPAVASAETWIPLHTGREAATYIDRDSRIPKGGNVRIMAMEVHRTPKALFGRATAAWIRTYEVDCTSGVFQVVSIEGLTASGQPVPGGMPEVKWQGTIADTSEWAVVELACGRDTRVSASTKGLDKAAALKRPIPPHKPIAGSPVAAAPAPAGESWLAANYGSKLKIYVDPGSRSQVGGVWYMTDLRILAKPRTIGGTPARVWIVRSAYDCAGRSLRTVSYEALDDAGSRKTLIPVGKVVWEPVKPNTDGETLLKIGCGEQRTLARTPLSRTQALADGLAAVASNGQ